MANEAPSNLIQVTVGNPDHQIKITPMSGTVVTVSGATSGLDQTLWFRILIAVIPTSASTGKIRTYVYHATNRYFIGETTYTSATVFITRVKVTQKWTAAGTMYLARLIAAKVSGVFSGCSLDAGYFGWDMSPQIPRDTNLYEIGRNPAHILAANFSGAGYRSHGSTDWWINHAKGGQTVGQMLTDFTDWVLSLKPRHVRIGSATNSCMAALSAGDSAVYMTQAKADYLSMVNQAIAIGAKVYCIGVAPRHGTLELSYGLERYAALAKDFNAWAKSTLSAIRVPFYDPWVDLEDPATPNQLNPLYAGADNVHWTKLGQEFVGRSEYQVYSGENL